MVELQDNDTSFERLLAATIDHVGMDYFRTLVRALVETLQIDFAMIGEIATDRKSIHSLASWNQEGTTEVFHYGLEGTPCEQVVAGEFCVYEGDLDKLFPKDTMVVKSNFDSYAGYSLSSSKGETIGLLVVLNREPFSKSSAIFTVLRFLAARAAAELERLRGERALRDALRDADSASRAKDGFLANISHELRTPLNAIIGFSELLSRHEVEPAKLKEYVGYIRDAGNQLLQTINAILELARAQAGDIRFRPDELVLHEILALAIELVEAQALERGIVIEDEVDHALCLPGDARLVRQMLVHLLGNAIKFSPENSLVTVRSALSSDGELVRVQVVDRGPGMSKEDIDLALRPFGRTVETRQQAIGGVGLGLPLTVTFMKVHGGDLEIESKKGQGTCVTLSFRRHHLDADALLDDLLDIRS